MKGFLITSENCAPCSTMKRELASFIKSGEIEEISLEKQPERVSELMNKYNIGLPGLVIVGENGGLITTS